MFVGAELGIQTATCSRPSPEPPTAVLTFPDRATARQFEPELEPERIEERPRPKPEAKRVRARVANEPHIYICERLAKDTHEFKKLFRRLLRPLQQPPHYGSALQNLRDGLAALLVVSGLGERTKEIDEIEHAFFRLCDLSEVHTESVEVL
jgi:hypothetical protein